MAAVRVDAAALKRRQFASFIIDAPARRRRRHDYPQGHGNQRGTTDPNATNNSDVVQLIIKGGGGFRLSSLHLRPGPTRATDPERTQNAKQIARDACSRSKDEPAFPRVGFPGTLVRLLRPSRRF